MFEAIGRSTQDDEAGYRSAAALGIVAFLATTCWCGVLGYGFMLASAEAPLAVEAMDDPLIPLFVDEPDLELAAPMGAPPPPPRAVGSPEPDAEPEPPDHEVAPTELEDPLEDVVRDAGVVGDVEGDDGGTADGKIGGVLGGAPDGTVGNALCDGCSPAMRLPSEKVRARRRVDPVYPESARSLGLSEVVCKLAVEIDAAGKPTDVQVSACPRAFHASAREALYRWRFYPARRAGQKVPARFSIAIRYKLTD